MLLFAAVVALAPQTTAPHLVAYWKGDSVVESVTGQSGKSMGGMTYEPGPFGKAFDFDGENSVLWFPDSTRFEFDKGMTLSAWVMLHTLPKYGSSPQAPIIFRGDDRPGLDPFMLAAESDGTFQFRMNDAANNTAEINIPAVVGQWVHLCASWDAANKTMNFWENGKLMATDKTDLVPLKQLDIHFNPAISVGNVQNPFGPDHFQPLNGSVAEVKIYDGAVSKSDFAKPKGWTD
jgi:hypothetical protein